MTQLRPLDLVAPGDIAARIGVTRNTVEKWRQRGVLPEPEWRLSSGPVWRWVTIQMWAVRTGRLA